MRRASAARGWQPGTRRRPPAPRACGASTIRWRSRMRWSNSASAFCAAHRVARHAALPRARRDLADDLALERRRVEPPLAGDDRLRGAHPLVEAERLEHERAARLEPRAELRPQPAGQPARRAGHRHAARVARGTPRRGRRAASRSRSTAPASAPFCGPNTRRPARTASARRTARRAARRAARRPRAIASIAPRAAVGRRAAARGDEHDRGARVDRGGDELAGAVRRRAPRRRARVDDTREPARLRDLDDRRPAVLDQRRTRPRPAGRADRTPSRRRSTRRAR